MPSVSIQCVICKKDIRMAQSTVKKHKIDVFICDTCASKAQTEFKDISKKEIDRLVKKSGY